MQPVFARPRPRTSVRRIEVALREDLLDPAGREAANALRDAGLPGPVDVRVVRLYFLGGGARLTARHLETAAREVLADPVLDRYAVDRALEPGEGPVPVAITVTRRPGVTDPEAESARTALASLGLPPVRVKSARTYLVRADAPKDQVLLLARRALSSEVIEEASEGRLQEYAFPTPRRFAVRRRKVRLRGLDGAALLDLSRKMGLSLDRAEMETVRDRFRSLGREPSDVELETIAQTWSEHCKHKTLTGEVRLDAPDGVRVYENLLKDTIFEATRRLAKPWCWSVFEDNAGVIDFDGEDGVCFKVETHNHPSAIEPYGGAGTGIGGVIRDILGTGLGARPVANTDVFAFGPPDLPREDVPKGALHPLRLLRGVVAGVRDYGNRMGIPTVNGAITFDPRYVGNPVVYCGCVGLIPRRDVEKAARPGDLVVAFGGRTGRDGIHGAVFASVELTTESESVSSGAVQIGDPITEKKVLDVLLQGRSEGLFTAVTDCGAGGFSSAVGEMGRVTGADVDLAAAPLKYEGLDAWEIWISEAQERMVAAIPPRRWARFRRLCEAEDVEAVVLGRFTGDGRLRVRHGPTLVADLDMEFLHEGLPPQRRDAVYRPPATTEPEIAPASRYDADLLALLARPEIGSKEWVIRQYDHEVQAGAVVRPLAGPNQGPADAAVLAPKLGSRRGIVLSSALNPGYGDVDPYEMALATVDEAIRNAVCVGADPARIALLDNFTWGNCNRPEQLGSLARAAEGCRDAALLFKTPFISGKDSLHNEFRLENGTVIAVPPTLLISAIGVVADVRRTATLDLKAPGDALYVVGSTHDECGGGRWYAHHGHLGLSAPRVGKDAPRAMRAVSSLVRRGWAVAAHDASEGGLAVALAEMCFASELGLDVRIDRAPRTVDHPGRLLFSESASRFLVEARPSEVAKVEAVLEKARVPFARIGRVTRAPTLVVRGSARGEPWIEIESERCLAAWRGALALE